MASTFFGLNIGTTGLYAYQAALDTTAHNITNAETDGYTRQVLGLQAGKALRVNSTYGMAGTGVNTTGIVQMRNDYYDMKYRKNSTIFGEYSTKEHYMVEIENYFNEISMEGFTTNFNAMYDSLQELLKQPSSLTVRTQVVNFAKSLTEYFNSLSQSMKGIQEECNFEIRNSVDKINSYAQQIAGVTKQINTIEVGGGVANDLRDQRALLIDQLSELVDLSVTESTVGDSGVGLTSYVVKINGNTLVDTANYNQLKVMPRNEKHNQNDIVGLYDVTWSNGQIFDIANSNVGGSLKALFEVRDGNNLNNLKGTVNATKGEKEVVLTDTNINKVEKLNIPEQGVITVNNRDYVYTGFEVAQDSETGNYTYTFQLEKEVVADVTNGEASIGNSINYKGIPYYMGQLNKFIRTFAKEFNELHKMGKDLENEPGIDFFNAYHKVNGSNYDLHPVDDQQNGFHSQTGPYYEAPPEGQRVQGSYYFITAENFTISEELLQNPSRLAIASDVTNGVEGSDILKSLLGLKSDKGMFKQGDPAGFLQTLVAEIGIDTKKAANFSASQENIRKAITNQRLSISGVDIDEEAMNLVRYQNAYNLSAKVITVMDEVYDRLINYMGA